MPSQGHPRSRGQKGQNHNFGFVWCDTCFYVRFLSRTQKMTLEHFFNGPNPAKNENRKIAEFLVNSVKVAFLVIQNGKTQPFFQDVNFHGLVKRTLGSGQ